MFKEIQNKDKKIAIVGLGYVGLPLALAFAEVFSVIGFDINEKRVELMQRQIDPSKEVSREEFDNKDILFTSDEKDLKDANFFIVAVPTPVDAHKVPNLQPVLSASSTIGRVLKKGDYVVFESTVYPGCTEEDCLVLLENESKLKLGEDFKLGYSPERINPGDKNRSIVDILKIVSGSDEEALKEIAAVYGSIIKAGIYEAPSIKVAEAAKVIENTQRDLNISFMNELSIIFDKLNIDTREVIAAASTKWNFIKLYPGLVGGHCISVDPYYLLHKAKEIGYDPQVILSGRRVNDNMPIYVAKTIVQKLIQQNKSPQDSKILVLGVTFKENVSDIRNSKVVDLVKELMGFSINVHISDPYASPNEVAHEYNLTLVDKISTDYDAVIIAVNHDEFKEFDRSELDRISSDKPVLFDLKGVCDPKDYKDIVYWRL